MKKRKQKTVKIIKLSSVFGVVLPLLFFALIPISKKLFFVTNQGFLSALAPQKVELSVESIYSTKLKEQLIEFVAFKTGPQEILHFNIDNFYKELMSNFKIIKEAEWNFSEPTVGKLKLLGARPFCKINEKFVLCDNKNLFNLDDFKEFDLQCLNNVNMAQEFIEDKNFSAINAFLERVPAFMWDLYDLDYQKDSNILLSSKKDLDGLKTNLIVEAYRFFDDKKISWADKIGRYLSQNTSSRFKKNKGYLFDLRFNNRICVRSISIQNRGRG
jgi:hypothetical protein